MDITELTAHKSRLSSDLVDLQIVAAVAQRAACDAIQQLQPIKNAAQQAQRAVAAIRSDIEHTEQQIYELTPKPTKVSHHAVVRYLERVMGLDMSEIEREIVSPKTQQLIYQLGDGKYPIGFGDGVGVRVVIKDNTAVTVV